MLFRCLHSFAVASPMLRSQTHICLSFGLSFACHLVYHLPVIWSIICLSSALHLPLICLSSGLSSACHLVYHLPVIWSIICLSSGLSSACHLVYHLLGCRLVGKLVCASFLENQKRFRYHFRMILSSNLPKRQSQFAQEVA